jgi:hypothetical protein
MQALCHNPGIAKRLSEFIFRTLIGGGMDDGLSAAIAAQSQLIVAYQSDVAVLVP